MSQLYVHREPIAGPGAWRAADVHADQSWIYTLTSADIGELERAIAQAKKEGLPTTAIRNRHFPLPSFAARIAQVWRQLEHGRGMAIVRGVPVDRYDPADLELLYWGISTHLGIVIPQNSKGDLIGRVEDTGVKWGEVRNGEIMRGYVTNATLPFHSDTGDVAALLCVRQAKSGGLTSVVSSSAIFNEILAHEPDLLETLFTGFYYSLRGENGGGVNQVSSYRIPVFDYCDGNLNGRYIRRTIQTAAKMGGPALTDLELRALDAMEKYSNSDELRFDMMMEPGDIQYVNNFIVLHSRTQFEDYEEPARKRLMIRVWLQVPQGRTLSRPHETLFGEKTPFLTRAQAMAKEGLVAA